VSKGQMLNCLSHHSNFAFVPSVAFAALHQSIASVTSVMSVRCVSYVSCVGCAAYVMSVALHALR